MKHLKLLVAVLLVGTLLMTTSCDILTQFLNPETPPEQPTHVHELKKVSSSSAGYAVHGVKFHYACACGKLFSDAAGTKPVTRSEVVIRSETGFDKQVYVAEDGYELNYCLYEPADLDEKKDLRPLIIFLHGAGERGSDNEAQLKNAILKVVGDDKDNEWSKSIVIAPQCPNTPGYGTTDVNDPIKWVETNWTKGNYVQANVPESKPMHALAELIKEYVELDYVDADRVYVVGLSMGGYGTWDLVSRYPELFAAAVPICGSGPSDMIDVLKDIPIYTFHGTADTAVPYSGTQGMYNAIVNAGGDQILFKTFQGQGHGIWDMAITYTGEAGFPALEDWLFEQNRLFR